MRVIPYEARKHDGLIVIKPYQIPENHTSGKSSHSHVYEGIKYRIIE